MNQLVMAFIKTTKGRKCVGRLRLHAGARIRWYVERHVVALHGTKKTQPCMHERKRKNAGNFLQLPHIISHVTVLQMR